MASIDYGIIALYFIVVIGLGFWYQKRAARNLESYFLGGRTMHWLALAMSGSVSNFDITGTMWIVSIIFVLGMKSMWHHWMWGVMMGAFFMAYMGKWVRRSNVMTAAEWMTTRFGKDRPGVVARTAYAVLAVITLASFVGYAYQGIGKFASIYLNLSPTYCAIIIIGTTTLYVLAGGLYSVVFTQILQTVILTFSSILIAAIAYFKLTPELLSNTLPAGWTSLKVPWRIHEFAGTDNAGFELFGSLVIIWVLKGLLLNAGGPAQMYDFQLFLASRNPRDAAKVGAAWSFFLIVRWAMCMGIALLAMTGIANVSDPEQVMPVVLQQYLPAGIKGIVIAGLFAAFMSTFSATVNGAASFVVRDLLQPFFCPNATQKQLVLYSRIATVAVVIIGILIGIQAKSISQIWNWMMMALGTAVIIPNALRWYWWRRTGWGFAAGTLAGILLSMVALFYPATPIYIVFSAISVASLFATVIFSLCTRPVDERTLVNFYKTVRPFGFWKPVKQLAGLTPDDTGDKSEKMSLAIINTILGMIAITGYYLFPMYLIGHWHVYAALCLVMALIATIVLKHTWYQNLPKQQLHE